MPRLPVEDDIVAEIAPTAWMAARGSALNRGLTDLEDPERFVMAEPNANIGDPTPDAHATLDNIRHTVTHADLVTVSQKCFRRVRKFMKVFGKEHCHEKMQASLDEFRGAGRGTAMTPEQLLTWHETFSFRLHNTVLRAIPPFPTRRSQSTRKSWDPTLAYADSHVCMYLLDHLIAAEAS